MSNGNAEEVIGAAISVPLGFISGLADLLIAKGVVSRQEVASIVQALADHSDHEWEREMVSPLLHRYQQT